MTYQGNSEKVCTVCGVAKPLTEFHRSNRAKGLRASRGGMGVEARCKQCKADARRPGIVAERMEAAALATCGQKRCTACRRVKSVEDFNSSRATKDGRCYKCAECAAEHLRTWRQANPGAFQRWYQDNAERRREYCRAWDRDNRALKAELYARWARANPHKINALIAKRNAAKRRASVSWADQSAILAIYAEAARLTRETGIRHEVDHFYPLQSEFVCGLHCEANLQILTKEENIRKLNRMPGVASETICV